MGTSVMLHVTLKSPNPVEASVTCWTLPARVTAETSSSEDDPATVYLQPRLAEALHVKEGESMEVTIHEFSKMYSLPIKLKARMSGDVLISDLVGLGIAESVLEDDNKTTEVVLANDGKVVPLPVTPMWYIGDTPKERRGAARLYFDGISRDSPAGPCGYGFHVVKGTYSARGEELVRGYGYAGMDKSSNEMEYYGLLEGLTWASRLDLRNLTIFGVSETIIKQLTGEYDIKNRRLKFLHDKVKALLDRNAGMKCNYQRIHREENDIAESLSNLGLATKETKIVCQWPQINQLLKRE
ncbi:ribonuclease H [Nitzschia inconspicua]|uniref:Ribonuclease H n=1 Tax=Nitzschia inconspicua TaxID=303405 RepID=A0A9K3Q3X6_9STRA|nr:ribonuclease H [Nitzschia inconspicua]